MSAPGAGRLGVGEDPFPRRLVVFGLGYTTTRLALRLAARGWAVAGTVRDPDRRDARIDRLRDAGVEVFAFSSEHDPERQAGWLGERLAGGGALLSSVPPDAEGDPVLARRAPEIATAGLGWIGYLSTTGVYGDHGGAVVDETTPTSPTGERGRRRVTAEAGWLALTPAAHIFRLAGIYGPGRSALDRLRAGNAQRIDKPGHAFSRIHVDDIVAVLEASLSAPRPGRIYNLADDEPAPSADVLAYAAGLLGIPPPPLVAFEEAELSAMARGFYRDNKRVSNARIRDELGVRLAFPDYRRGLADIAATGERG